MRGLCIYFAAVQDRRNLDESDNVSKHMIFDNSSKYSNMTVINFFKFQVISTNTKEPYLEFGAMHPSYED